MASSTQLLGDVEFIFAECMRYRQLHQQWLETRDCPDELRQAFLYELQHPTDPRGKITCGREAMRRLEGLAAVAARRAGIDRQVDILTIRKALARALLIRFVINRLPIDAKHLDRALAEAGRHAAASRATVTHFVPCHLMLAQEPATFRIGPVLFLRRQEFRTRLAVMIRARGPEKWKDRKFLARASDYYRGFSWVAEVTVPNCDTETSKAVAERTVTAALDCLHLLVRARNSARMSVGGPALHKDWRAAFTIKEARLLYSRSYGGPGEVAFEDDWITFFDDPDNAGFLHLCGVALEAAVDPALDRPISNRFLDAASWFGEGVRERAPGAKVIKFVTALERMLMTDEGDDIAKRVSQRAAAFCARPENPRTYFDVREKAQRAYALRSKLAHGSLSPGAPEALEGVRLGSELGEDAILCALAAFGETGLRSERVNRRHLSDWFNQIAYGAEAHFNKAPSTA